jgi:hypothetical protein
LRLARKTDSDGRIALSDRPVAAIELHDVVGNPERVVWRLVCGSVMAESNLRPGLRIGLVVDSSLGQLEVFNLRQCPILDDWYLPGPFTLIYASADSASECIANWLIRACDREARMLLDGIERSAPLDKRNLQPTAADEPWTFIRNWRWSASGG